MADPVWLPDVLRAAGLEVREYPGWRDRGHGDFGSIWGVVCHHTGSFGESARGIAEHPDLGLCSQLHLSAEGVYTICGVGIAWHAGMGAYPGLPTNNANGCTIGIEAANDGGGRPGLPHRASWPDAQYDAYVRGVAAILDHLGEPASHAIGHKEWAGAAQGKWDPGAIDMNIFRADVARLIATGDLEQGDDEMGWLETQVKNFKDRSLSWKDVLWFMDRNTSQTRDQLLGEDGPNGFKGWKILGRSTIDPNRDNTLVEALAEHKTETAAELAEIKGALTTILSKLEDRA
ncbi:peptidoglycan recognition protein family protein [Nocardia beijingensis]|uniref:peptidoglycan recognition protein family protein n=1 Tax=Nocardia beijingensis TaxID=95162 RepID=UPI00339EC8DB